MITAADFKAVPRGGEYSDPSGNRPEGPFVKARFYRGEQKYGVAWGLGSGEDVRDTVQRVSNETGLVVQYVVYTADDLMAAPSREEWQNIAPAV